MTVQLLPYVVYDSLPDEAHEVAFAEIEKAAQEEQYQNTDDDEVQRINILIRQYLIDNVFNQPRHDDVARAGKGHTNNGYDEAFFIRRNKPQQTFIALPAVILLHSDGSP